eukprot:2849359-Rhodomonas_salina.2
MVMEYRGEIITLAQKNKRLEKIGVNDPVYFQEFDRCSAVIVVDARTYGSPARFVNHTCGEANLRFATWWTDGIPRCVLEAQREI